MSLALDQASDLSKAIPPGGAVLYVIPLPDRTEILVGTSKGTKRFKSSVPEKL